MKSNGRNSVILAPNSRLRQRAAAMRGTFLAAALCLGGCQSSSLQDVTGSIGGASDSDIRRSAAELGRRYDRNPDDRAIALKYARALRGMTENAQAVAILQRLAIKFPRDVEVLGAYGKALADAGGRARRPRYWRMPIPPSGRNAEEVARRDLDAEDAAADVAAIRRMIAQSNTWKRIQEPTPSHGPSPRPTWEAISNRARSTKDRLIRFRSTAAPIPRSWLRSCRL